MIGGETEVVDRLSPIFASIAPGVDSAPRTPGRTGEPSPAEHGYYHCGPNGAGHFVKMVHNGIEYGLMAAYAEGLNVIANADMGKRQRDMDAETAPLERPELYQYEIDTTEVAEVWRRGSVVGSWLLDLTAAALHESPTLEEFAGRVSDSGEGRWTSIAAIEEGVPTPVLTTALYSRFASREHGRLRQPAAVGDAQAVRRPRREEAERDGARGRGPSATPQAVAERGAEIVAAAAAAAVAERGRFTFAVSGGRTPWAMFAALYGRMPWEKVTIFQVDERVAPDGDPDRNLTQLQRSLPPGGVADVRPMPVWADDLEAARLRTRTRSPSSSTSSISGSGPDGHTASLVPGDPVLDVTDRDVALTGEYQGRRRMTLTYPALEPRAPDPLARDRRGQGRRARAAACGRPVDPGRPRLDRECARRRRRCCGRIRVMSDRSASTRSSHVRRPCSRSTSAAPT